MDVKKIVSQSKFAQVGFVVNDIEKAKKQFALLFGCEIPPTCDCGTFDVTQTQIYGKPAPDAACVMAFFDMTPGVQLELIQPSLMFHQLHNKLTQFLGHLALPLS